MLVKEISRFFGSFSDLERVVRYATCDSRQVKKGTLFFALAGERSDGHFFLEEVSKKGGEVAVVSQEYKGASFGLELIFVPDVRQGLQSLAREVLQRKKPLVIGVTGTVGKTTTKEFISGILDPTFRVGKNEGSMNSQIGLPLTLLNWEGQDDILVLEMGMSKRGELARLVEIASPELGVLTKISLAHAAFFTDIEEIAQEKCELFTSKKIKHAFLNRDTMQFKAVRNIQTSKTWFEKWGLHAPFSAGQLLENLGAAVSVARYLGMTEEVISQRIQTLKPCSHRGEKIVKQGVLFIDDSYNASPASATAAFESMPKGKKRLALFGAMKELGSFEELSHLKVAKSALPIIDELLCLGKECQPMVDLFKKKGKKVNLFDSKEEAIKHLKRVIESGDIVLLKGSNSFKLWTVLEEF